MIYERSSVAGGLAREVHPARLRPGWRLAIALPLAIAVAIGAAEVGHVALAALRPVARRAGAEAFGLAVSAIMDRPAAAAGDCGHGTVLVAAMAIVAVAALLGVLLGAAIVRGLGQRGELHIEVADDGDDGDDGDGGDEDELDLPFDAERVVVIAVPRRDAPGAPQSPGPNEAN